MAVGENYRKALRALSWASGRRVLALGAAGGFGEVVARLSMPWIVGLIIDDALVRGDGASLVHWCVVLAAVATAAALLRGVFEVSFSYSAARSLGDLQERLFGHLHAVGVSDAEGDTSGRLNALFTNDARKVGLLYSPIARQFLYAVFQLVVLTAILLYRYGSMIALAGLIVPIYVLFPLLLGKPTRRASRRLQESEAEVSSWLQEAIGGLREIRALVRSGWSAGRLSRRVKKVVRERLRLSLIHWGYGSNRILYWMAMGVIYWQGGQRVLAGEMSIGALVALVAYLGYLEAPVGRLFSIHSKIESLAGPLERVMAFLGRPAHGRGGAQLVLQRPPAIELDGVTFRYGDDAVPALDHLDLRVEPGQQAAIVGSSGAGKSTLLRLLLGFEQPESGEIRIDDRDLASLDVDSLRRSLAVVFQRPTLFSMSIEENIRLGDPGATAAEVREAARAAFADGFIRRLPDGYDTHLGEAGAGLSVGQRQRIAIARALLRDAPVVLLDEATSALDASSEEAVCRGLERLIEGRTSLVIAHRLATVREADRIFVLEAGRLTAAGAHHELIEHSETYREFHRLQAA